MTTSTVDGLTFRKHLSPSALLAGFAIPGLMLGNGMMGALFALAVILGAWRVGLTETAEGVGAVFRRPVWLAVAAVLASWLVTVSLSIDPLDSAGVLVRVPLFLLGGLIVWRALSALEGAAALAGKALIAASLFAFGYVAATMYVFHDLAVPLRLVLPGLSATQGFIAYSSAAACAIPALIGFGLMLRGRWLIAALAAVLLALPIIWAHGHQTSNSAIAGLMAAAVGVPLLAGLARLPRWLRLGVVALCLAVALLAGKTVVERLPEPPVTAEDAAHAPLPVIDWHRQVIWGFVYHSVWERPWFGYGMDTINTVPGAHDMVPELNQEYVPSHPHNWLLEVWSETGTVGLALFLLALFLAVRDLTARANRHRTPMAWAALGVFVVFWTSSLSNFSIWASWWQCTAVMLMAIMLAADTASAAESP